MGPMTYAKHLVSGSRLPFTAAYFGSIGLTIYFSVGVSHVFVTLGRSQNADFSEATQHHPHLDGCDRPDRMSSLVPSQLLPDGIQWSPPRHQLRRAESSDLDDWLSHVNCTLSCFCRAAIRSVFALHSGFENSDCYTRLRGIPRSTLALVPCYNSNI